jgi:CBS domain-containing protein
MRGAHDTPSAARVKVRAPIGPYLAPSFERARVRDAMHPGVLAATKDTPLITVAQRMAGEHVHAIVVRGEGQDAASRRHWAVVTGQDVLRCAARVEELTAEEAASCALLEVHPDDRLADAAAQMLEHGATHVLVVDPDTDRPIGVTSTLDIAWIVAWGRD